MDAHVYQTSVKWTGDSRAVLAADGLPSIEVATPPEIPGGHPGIWSPEHLYTAASEACLVTTSLATAEELVGARWPLVAGRRPRRIPWICEDDRPAHPDPMPVMSADPHADDAWTTESIVTAFILLLET